MRRLFPTEQALQLVLEGEDNPDSVTDLSRRFILNTTAREPTRLHLPGIESAEVISHQGQTEGRPFGVDRPLVAHDH